MLGFKDAVAKKTRRVGGQWWLPVGLRRVCGVDWGRWTTAPNNRPEERSHRQPIRSAPPQIMRARTGPSLPQSLLEELSGQAGAYEFRLDPISLSSKLWIVQTIVTVGGRREVDSSRGRKLEGRSAKAGNSGKRNLMPHMAL